MYYDLNKNGFYDIGIDKPIANTLILLVKGVKARAAQSVLGSTTSDSQGNFVILFNVQNPGITLNVVKVKIDAMLGGRRGRKSIEVLTSNLLDQSLLLNNLKTGIRTFRTSSSVCH